MHRAVLRADSSEPIYGVPASSSLNARRSSMASAAWARSSSHDEISARGPARTQQLVEPSKNSPCSPRTQRAAYIRIHGALFTTNEGNTGVVLSTDARRRRKTRGEEV